MKKRAGRNPVFARSMRGRPSRPLVGATDAGEVRFWRSAKVAAYELGVSVSHLRHCIGESHQCKGYYLDYVPIRGVQLKMNFEQE